MKTAPEFFDPYHILELPLGGGSNSSVIRSQYRKLSLKYHPDKNPGDRRNANLQFNKVAKAYQVTGKKVLQSFLFRYWTRIGAPDTPHTTTLLPIWSHIQTDGRSPTGTVNLPMYQLAVRSTKRPEKEQCNLYFAVAVLPFTAYESSSRLMYLNLELQHGTRVLFAQRLFRSMCRVMALPTLPVHPISLAQC